MIEGVRSGTSPGSLAKEFEPSAQTIHTRVNHADLDSGRRRDARPPPNPPVYYASPPDQTVAHRGRHSGKSSCLVRSQDRLDPQSALEWVKAFQAFFPLTPLGGVLGIPPPATIGSARRRASARCQAEARIQAHVEAIPA